MRIAIFYILFATFAFGLMNSTAKALSDLHPMQVVSCRAFGTFIFIFPFMLYKGISVKGNRPGWLLLRALVGVISLGTFFAALQRVPLGSAISIRYLGPVFAALLAMWWLRERVTSWQWLFFGIAFTGVIVLKGFDLRIDALSLSLLLVSAVFIGGVFVLIRFLANQEHHLTIINYFMVTAILSGLLFFPQWRMPAANEWWAVLSIGVYGMAGQVFMTKAYQHAETNVVAPFKYMELFWGLLLGYFFFQETYNYLAILGMLLILIGMVGNVLSKQLSNKKARKSLS